MLKKIICDLSLKLESQIAEEDINFFTEGATDSIVFSVFDKYLVKTMDENTLRTQKEFLNFYNEIGEFQKIIFTNEALGYICFEFIEGEKFKKNIKIYSKNIVKNVYDIVNKYKKYNNEYYGYLFEDEKSWYKFLEDEVRYSSKEIMDIVLMDKVNDALKNIENETVDKYLIHGDFGTHNFLFSNGKINVIDPMPVVGDYLYDFYFALLSNNMIFKKLDLEYILEFFDRNMEYKKNLFIIILYIRMSRAFKYNKESFEDYLNLYNKI